MIPASRVLTTDMMLILPTAAARRSGKERFAFRTENLEHSRRGENITKSDNVFCKFFLQRGNLRGRLRSGFVFQEQPEHEVNVNELKGHDHFSADSADDGVHCHNIAAQMFIETDLIIVVSSVQPNAIGHKLRRATGARPELRDTRQVNR